MVPAGQVKNKAWFGLHAALRDLLYDWSIQQQALSALRSAVERGWWDWEREGHSHIKVRTLTNLSDRCDSVCVCSCVCVYLTGVSLLCDGCVTGVHSIFPRYCNIGSARVCWLFEKRK